MSDSETFGQRLKRLRLAAELSQYELAGDELDPSYISLLEHDRRQPTASVVETLADRLGCAPEFLADGRSDPEALLLARAELGVGDPSGAIARLRPIVLPLAETSRLSRFEFDAVEVYAIACERVGDLAAAIEWLERLFRVAEADPRQHSALAVSTALVRNHRDAGNLTRAALVGDQALTLCRTIGLPSTGTYGRLIATVASVYYEAGDLAHAASLLGDLATSAESEDNPQDQAYAYWNAAILAAQVGRVAEGQDLADKAAVLLDTTDDLRSRSRIKITRARLHLEQTPPDPRAARAILREELPNLRQHDGVGSVASAETELALCELLLNRPAVARRLAASSIKRLGDSNPVEKARAEAIHGAALVASDETQAGLSEFELSIESLVDLGAMRQAASTLKALATVYQTLGDLPAAFECSQRALTLLGVTSSISVTPVGQHRSTRRAHV